MLRYIFNRKINKEHTREANSVRRFMYENESHKRIHSFLGYKREDADEYYKDSDEIYFQESLGDVGTLRNYEREYEEDPFCHTRVDVEKSVLDAFIRLPLSKSLLSVPGINLSMKRVFFDHSISNTHQLIGQFLMFHSITTDPQLLANKFYTWLREIGIVSNRATITACLAEKIGTWFPDVYDVETYHPSCIGGSL